MAVKASEPMRPISSMPAGHQLCFSRSCPMQAVEILDSRVRWRSYSPWVRETCGLGDRLFAATRVVGVGTPESTGDVTSASWPSASSGPSATATGPHPGPLGRRPWPDRLGRDASCGSMGETRLLLRLLSWMAGSPSGFAGLPPTISVAPTRSDTRYKFAKVHSYSRTMLSATSAVCNSLGRTPKV